MPKASVSVKSTVNGTQPDVSLIFPSILDLTPFPIPANSNAIFTAARLHMAPSFDGLFGLHTPAVVGNGTAFVQLAQIAW